MMGAGLAVVPMNQCSDQSSGRRARAAEAAKLGAATSELHGGLHKGGPLPPRAPPALSAARSLLAGALASAPSAHANWALPLLRLASWRRRHRCLAAQQGSLVRSAAALVPLPTTRPTYRGTHPAPFPSPPFGNSAGSDAQPAARAGSAVRQRVAQSPPPPPLLPRCRRPAACSLSGQRPAAAAAA